MKKKKNKSMAVAIEEKKERFFAFNVGALCVNMCVSHLGFVLA